MERDTTKARTRPRKAWFRPSGAGGLWQVGLIALPMIISTGTWSVMIFTDRAFLFKSSTAEVAAAMPAGMLYWTSISFFVGLCSYTNTFVAQYAGAGRPQRIADSVVHGLYLALSAIPFLAGLFWIAPWLFQWAGHEQLVAKHETTYLRILVAAAMFDIATHTISCYWTGRGKTLPIMIVSLISCLANIPLDYVLIFGYGPIPQLGIAGAAYATAASFFLRIVLFSCWLAYDRRKAVGVSWRNAMRFDRELIGRMIWYGAPAGIGFTFEASAMALLVLALGRYGESKLAASSLAMSINAIAFTPLIGLSIAASTLVGQFLTRGRPALAKRALWSAVLWGGGASAIFAVCCVVAPDALMAIQRIGSAEDAVDAERYASLRPTAVVILQFVAVYCVFDALQMLFGGALKGAGDTRFVLGASVVISLSAVGIGWVGGVWFNYGFWFWYVMLTVWLITLAIVFGIRFLSNVWTKMRVIEHDVLPEHAHTLAATHDPEFTSPFSTPAQTTPASGANPRGKLTPTNHETINGGSI